MFLWLITFKIDNTQFLVEANSVIEAIKIANTHNSKLDEVDDYDFSCNFYKDYEIDRVNFNLLTEIIQRNDVWDVTAKSIAFVG